MTNFLKKKKKKEEKIDAYAQKNIHFLKVEIPGEPMWRDRNWATQRSPKYFTTWRRSGLGLQHGCHAQGVPPLIQPINSTQLYIRKEIQPTILQGGM